jgi:hypothetical protein
MLVVTANWAIADGTVHGGPPNTAVRAFFRELRRTAWRAGFRHNGRYRPVDSIQIVFAGDTFDGLASLAWHGDLRPWQGGPRARSAAEQIAAAAARRGARLLAALGRLRRNGLSVPRADERGRPLPGTTCQAAVSVVCLVGDRDRVLDGHWFTAVAGRHGIPIGTEWSSDAVVVRHGAECDPLCGVPDLPVHGRAPTLAESLTVDLLVDFSRRLQDAPVPRATAAAVTSRLATAPPLQMPHTIAGCHEPAIRAVWQRSVQHWHSQAHATMPEAAVAHDTVDALAAWMEVGSGRDRHGLRHSPAAVIDGLHPRVPRRWSDSRLFVLGHPPATMHDVTEVGVRGGLCLGPAMAGALSMPAAVAFPVCGSQRGIWLTQDQWKVDRARTIHVAPCGGMSDEPGIVDAA